MLILAAVFCFGLLAGFVDAIAGGGGLIMLPGLLLTGMPVGLALGTNKLAGTCGAIASSIRFARAGRVDWRAVSLMGIPAFCGSLTGARCIGILSKDVAEPVVITLMILITILVVANPALGRAPAGEPVQHDLRPRTAVILATLGFVIGFHDGFFGPGTGTFLVFALLRFRKLDFLLATGTTKWVNLLTNVAALGTFMFLGNINYQVGLCGAAGLATGAWLGAGLANRVGAPLIRPLFIVVTILLVVRMVLT
jgi:uncharacterized membrane protein YfcA